LSTSFFRITSLQVSKRSFFKWQLLFTSKFMCMCIVY